MSDVFLSYANKDLDRVMPLIKELQDCGLTVFWDLTIPTGKNWRDMIHRELESARCIVVIWSKNSVASEWVQDEAEEGKQRKILLPVKIDAVSPPLGFRAIQFADLINWPKSKDNQALTKIIVEIKKVVGSDRPTTNSQSVPRNRQPPQVKNRFDLRYAAFLVPAVAIALWFLGAFEPDVKTQLVAQETKMSGTGIETVPMEAANNSTPAMALPLKKQEIISHESANGYTVPAQKISLMEDCKVEDPPVSCLFGDP